MDTNTLINYVEKLWVHAFILNGYKGTYSLGVGQTTSGEPAFVLITFEEINNDIPQEIVLEGTAVSVQHIKSNGRLRPL